MSGEKSPQACVTTTHPGGASLSRLLNGGPTPELSYKDSVSVSSARFLTRAQGSSAEANPDLGGDGRLCDLVAVGLYVENEALTRHP